MAAEVDPAHVSVVHLSLNMVQPTMSEFQVTPATPIALLGVAPITPARNVPCPEQGSAQGWDLAKGSPAAAQTHAGCNSVQQLCRWWANQRLHGCCQHMLTGLYWRTLA